MPLFIPVALGAWLLSMVGSLTARVLFSLGFGIVSYAALTTLLGGLVSAAQSRYAMIDPAILQFLNLGGVGESMGIIAAAFATRATMSAIKSLRPV
jgi:hypothetical protein